MTVRYWCFFDFSEWTPEGPRRGGSFQHFWGVQEMWSLSEQHAVIACDGVNYVLMDNGWWRRMIKITKKCRKTKKRFDIKRHFKYIVQNSVFLWEICIGIIHESLLTKSSSRDDSLSITSPHIYGVFKRCGACRNITQLSLAHGVNYVLLSARRW